MKEKIDACDGGSSQQLRSDSDHLAVQAIGAIVLIRFIRWVCYS
jgi:hypothetical protein